MKIFPDVLIDFRARSCSFANTFPKMKISEYLVYSFERKKSFTFNAVII
jgi:hypothetical protein